MFPRDGTGMNMNNMNSGTYSPYLLLHSSVLEEQSAKIQKMLDNHEKLIKELDGLKNKTEKLQHQMKEFIQQKLTEHFHAQATQLKQELQERSHFKKDKVCYVQGCNKKYSSRIALRAHMKKNHTPRQLGKNQEYVP